MTILFAVFALLFLFGVTGISNKFSTPRGDYLSRDTTAAVNGLFICIVFLSHLRSYIPEEAYTQLDAGFLKVIIFLGQLIVTTFLFYSGYGIMESIKNKEGYIAHFPRRRILPFFLDFWLAVFVFLLVNISMGVYPDCARVLLSLVGWSNLGNSNWYIFAIAWMYLFTYIAFRVFPKERQRLLAIALVSVGGALYALLNIREGNGGWWYSTILCYPAGMLFSHFLARIRRIVNDGHGIPYWLLLVALLAVFLLLHPIRFRRAIVFNVMSIVFALVIVLVSAQFRGVGKPFVWAGRNLFCCYIYQRIPMMYLQHRLASHTLAYTIVCLALAIPLCVLMTHVHKKYKELVFQG